MQSEIERLKILCDLVVRLVEIRQRECSHLCVENIAVDMIERIGPLIVPEMLHWNGGES